jgi:hypothetical protein
MHCSHVPCSACLMLTLSSSLRHRPTYLHGYGYSWTLGSCSCMCPSGLAERLSRIHFPVCWTRQIHNVRFRRFKASSPLQGLMPHSSQGSTGANPFRHVLCRSAHRYLHPLDLVRLLFLVYDQPTLLHYRIRLIYCWYSTPKTVSFSDCKRKVVDLSL